MYICIYIYIYKHTYIHRERERENEREIDICFRPEAGGALHRTLPGQPVPPVGGDETRSIANQRACNMLCVCVMSTLT